MYADRYAKSGGFKPASFTLALAINGAILTGLLLFTNPAVRRHFEPVLEGRNIPLDQPPPPAPKPIERRPELKTTPSPAPEHVDTTPTVTHSESDFGIAPLPLPPVPGTGTTIDTVVEVPKPLPPVMVQPSIRDIANFQPVYPADEARAGNGGRVVVRVLVGVDGRVKAVERVSATSNSFFEATRRRALDKWRFKPGTRDGIPVEAWREIGVSFVLDDASR